ncbi:Hypothetical protein HVR_LOCUS234 [uncultured virus]|nr:Hypothetical protein HVR_LOCUS234 [uncultured virus]
MWEPGFNYGQAIGANNEARMAMEIVSGLSNNAVSTLAQVNSQQEAINNSLNMMEHKLKVTVDNAITRMTREINNLLVETRSAVKDLSAHVSTQLANVNDVVAGHTRLIDDSIKEKISKTIETELEFQIGAKIGEEIENSHEKIKGIVTEYVINDGKRLVTDAVDKRESEIQGTLVGLEHRIEILYNKLESSQINYNYQKITDLTNTDDEQSNTNEFIFQHDPFQNGFVGLQNIDIEIDPSNHLDGVQSQTELTKRDDTERSASGKIIDINSVGPVANVNVVQTTATERSRASRSNHDQQNHSRSKGSNKSANKSATPLSEQSVPQHPKPDKSANKSVTPLSDQSMPQQSSIGRSQPWNRRRIIT